MLFPFSGQRKFKKKIQYVKEMHGSLEAVDTEDEAAHAIVPPCLIIAPEVFWPQDLNAKHTFSILENAKNVDDAMLNGTFYLEQLANKFILK